MVALSGCGAVPGINTASIESMDPTVEDGRAVLSFDYSVDDYATALFEGPDGRVISETRIEPDHTTASVPIGTLGGGEYQLLLRQDGDTVTSETLSVEGADLLISDITSSWSYNELRRVSVDLENAGDVPAYIELAEFELEQFDTDYNPSSIVNGYLNAGDSGSVDIEPVGGAEVEQSGTAEGTVTVETGAEPLTEGFSYELEAASLEFTKVDPKWDGNTLVDVTADVQNTGDVPTTAQITATADGEELDTTPTEQIEPGERQEFVAQQFGTLYEATSGGQANIDITVESPAGSITETVTREIAGADVSLDTVSAGWGSGQLVEVYATIGNSGDLEVEAPLTVSVGDEVVRETTATLPGGTSATEVLVYDSTGNFEEGYAITSGGTYEVTVELELEDSTVSASDSK